MLDFVMGVLVAADVVFSEEVAFDGTDDVALNAAGVS
jgi:hypothetical protein